MSPKGHILGGARLLLGRYIHDIWGERAIVSLVPRPSPHVGERGSERLSCQMGPVLATGNLIAQKYLISRRAAFIFLGNMNAARKFDRSRCHGNWRLLLSMTTQSLTPRSQSLVGELP